MYYIFFISFVFYHKLNYKKMKISSGLLLILFLLIGCGKIRLDVGDSRHDVTHEISLPDIEKLCKDQNPGATNGELDICEENYKKLLENL